MRCAAYPEQIPDDIADGADHRQARGDEVGGLVYERAPGARAEVLHEAWLQSESAHQTERFDPDQPRDSHGRWIGVGMGDDELAEVYGDVLDEVEFAPGSFVTAAEDGEVSVRFDELDGGQSVLADGLTPLAAWNLGVFVGEILDEVPDEDDDPPPVEPNGLAVWEVRDGWLVGYRPDGTVKVGAPAAAGGFDDFDLDADEAYMFSSALRRMAAAAARHAGQSTESWAGAVTTALGLWRAAESGRHRAFDPGQPRDHDGQWTDGTPGPASVGAADKLNLAGRIDLAPGERLVASGSVSSVDYSDVALAATTTPEGPVLRVGIVAGDDVRRWRGSNKGGTVKLDAAGTQQLRDAMVAALAEAKTKRAALRKAYDLAERQGATDDLPEPDAKFGGGAVAGEWGDLAFELWGQDIDLGWQMWIAVRPKDAGPDWDIYEGTGSTENYAQLEAPQVKRLIKQLDAMAGDGARESLHDGGIMTSALALWRATEGRKKFDPNQPRDADGQWTDGPGGGAAQKVAAAGNKHVEHLEGLGSREEAHTYLASIKGAELEELRKAVGVKRGTAASVRQRIADQTAGSKADTRALLGTGGTDFGWGDANWNRGENAFTPSAPAAKAAPAKRAPAARAKASGKTTDEHISALSAMSPEDAAAYVGGLPGKELDAILAMMPTARRARTLADKRNAVVVGSVGFKADAKAVSGTDDGVLANGGAGALGAGSLKFGEWANDTAPKKRAPRKKAAAS